MEPSASHRLGLNISTPVWNPADHLLLFSSAYGTGTRALELRQAARQDHGRERWAVSRVRVHIGTHHPRRRHRLHVERRFGPAFLTAVNVKTGAIAWQDRAFARAQMLYADGKLIVLDEDGRWRSPACRRKASRCWRARRFSRPRVDAADAGRHDALRPRSQDHRRLDLG